MSKKRMIVIAVLLGVVALGGVGAVGFWQYHEQPQFCATCHIMEPYLESWQASEYGAAAHAAQGVTCLDCHEPTTQQQVDELVAYVQGDFTVPLEERQFSDDFCFDCHLPNEHTSYDEVIQLTAGMELNPHDSHLVGEMDCETCHKMHGLSEDYCAECHGPLSTRPGWTTEVAMPAGVAVWTPDMDCTVCHVMTPYVESLEDPDLLAYAHAQAGLTCTDCHSDLEALADAHVGAVAGSFVDPRTFDMDFCFGCHVPTPHTSDEAVVELTGDLDPNPHSGGVECYYCHQMHR